LRQWDETSEFNYCISFAILLHVIFLIIIHISSNIYFNEIPYKTVKIKMGIDANINTNNKITHNYFTQETRIAQPIEAQPLQDTSIKTEDNAKVKNNIVKKSSKKIKPVSNLHNANIQNNSTP